MKSRVSPGPQPAADTAQPEPTAASSTRPGQPQLLVKTVVAHCGALEPFAARLASDAHRRGLHAAQRKAFVADGAEAN